MTLFELYFSYMYFLAELFLRITFFLFVCSVGILSSVNLLEKNMVWKKNTNNDRIY